MSRNELVGARSAMPTSMKVNILAEEGWRRILNSSSSLNLKISQSRNLYRGKPKTTFKPDLTSIDDDIRLLLIDFNRQMKKDDHSEKLREQIMEKVLQKWSDRVRDDLEGRRSYYRGRKERQGERKERGRGDKTSWFKRGGYQGVLKVQHTPGSQLAKNIQRRIQQEVPSRKLKVQEALGGRLEGRVTSSREPWVLGGCQRSNCHLCSQSGGERKDKSNCWSRGCNYTITCMSFDKNKVMAKYFGETTNVYKRASTHFNGFNKGKWDNVLHAHRQQYHANQNITEENFLMEVMSQQQLPLERQAMEGVAIIAAIGDRDNLRKVVGRQETEHEEVVIMNSRREFQQPLGGIKCSTSYLH